MSLAFKDQFIATVLKEQSVTLYVVTIFRADLLKVGVVSEVAGSQLTQVFIKNVLWGLAPNWTPIKSIK